MNTELFIALVAVKLACVPTQNAFSAPITVISEGSADGFTTIVIAVLATVLKQAFALRAST
ncbi:hypothetical protein D3C86_2247620 [compost metagenome]